MNMRVCLLVQSGNYRPPHLQYLQVRVSSIELFPFQRIIAPLVGVARRAGQLNRSAVAAAALERSSPPPMRRFRVRASSQPYVGTPSAVAGHLLRSAQHSSSSASVVGEWVELF